MIPHGQASQSNLSEAPSLQWQTPPVPIADMLAVERPAAIVLSTDSRWLLELIRPPRTTIADLTDPLLALAGTKINPKTWGPARASGYEGIILRSLISTPGDAPSPANSDGIAIELPDQARVRDLSWSYDCRYLAFTLLETDGFSLWLLDVESAQVRQLTGPILNCVLGSPYRWLPGDQGLICKVIPPQMGEPPEAPSVPPGPKIAENLGRTVPARTYTNLLKDAHDDALFEYYFTAQLEQISLTGERRLVTPPALIRGFQPSPDGQWIRLSTMHRPFSYHLSLQRFPLRTEIVNLQGQSVYEVVDQPLADEIPIAFEAVRQGRRSIAWRADQPACLTWIEALDGGDPSQEVPFRDQMWMLAAPFTEEPTPLWKTELRCRGIAWGHDTIALGYEGWYDQRTSRIFHLNPSDLSAEPVLLETRNTQDAYANPGQPLTAPGPWHWRTLLFAGDGVSLYREGRGASPDGVYPFLDRFNVDSRVTERLWQATDPYFERVTRLLDPEAQRFITVRQSQQEPPQYWLHTADHDAAIALTLPEDPLPWYSDVQKQLVRYSRQDGVELSAVLYLPPAYDSQRDGPLPTLLWAYPEEHKSRDTASQVTTSENTFSRPGGSSILFLLTQGYAVLMGPSMPIVGEGDEEPNDTYIEQLVESAQAAVDYLVKAGVSEPGKIAIGGHSYGAFTTANLLAHCDLFCAGIARSGAYNRTLTPFGFQGEQRNFWDAPETYINISPFTHAEKIKSPLLLIHGEDDNNSGTYPLQTERLYEAMRGLGGTVRWVLLPLEGHGYRSQEAVGHVLWEMVRWCDRYVKKVGDESLQQE